MQPDQILAVRRLRDFAHAKRRRARPIRRHQRFTHEVQYRTEHHKKLITYQSMQNHLQNASWSGAITGYRGLVGIANALLAVRLLGIENYGHIVTLLSVFVLYLSLNNSVYMAFVAKLMSPEVVENSVMRSEILVSAALITVCSISLLAAINYATYLISPFLFNLVKNPGMGLAFLMMGALVALQILSALQSAVIESTGRLDLAMKAQLLGPTLGVILLVMFFILHIPLSPKNYVAILCFSVAIDLFLLWVVRRLMLHLVIWQSGCRIRMQSIKSLLRSSSALQATALMNLIIEPLNKLLLNHFVGPLAVTTYDLIMKVISGIQALFGSAMRVFLHLANQQGITVGEAYARTISLITMPALTAHTIGALLMAWVANHWANIEATQLMFFYALASVGNLSIIFATPLFISLVSRSDLRFIFLNQSQVLIIKLAVSVALVPFVGLHGVALGFICASFYYLVTAYRRHQIIVGESSSLELTIYKNFGRFSFGFLLFFASIFLGLFATQVSFLWLTIILAIAVIIRRDPLVSLLLARQNKFGKHV